MRKFLINILSKTEGTISTSVFDIWHFLYLIIIVGAIIGAAFALKGRSEKTKKTTLNVIAIVTLALYIFDFFVQPFVSSNKFELNIDKLPFHICTLMGIVAVFAQFSNKQWFKETAVALSLTAAMMYLVYPGTALDGVPWCYKVMQTMIYHGMLFAWAVLNLTTKQTKLSFKNIWMPIIGLVIVALWATVGNVCYNSSYAGGDGNHHWDWFFLTGSTFGLSPWLQPFLTIAAFTAVLAMVYLIYWGVVKISAKIKDKKQTQQTETK